MMRERIGIDLGGTKIEVILLNELGETAFRLRKSTPQENYEATLKAIADLVLEADLHTKVKGIPVGVGTPGAVSSVTGAIKNSNSLCLMGKQLDEDLEKLLQRPVKLANDANCFTLSEACDGAGQGFQSVFGIILGTGCGGGLVINKNVIVGRNSIAGEWGHNSLPRMTKNPILDIDEERVASCYCGKNFCNELFISGTGLAANHNRRFAVHLSGEEIISRYSQGEEASRRSIDIFLDQLARALSQVVNLLDPDVIVMGGGLSNFEEIYLQLPERLKAYVFSGEFVTPIRKAQHGDSSGVRGAAWLF